MLLPSDWIFSFDSLTLPIVLAQSGMAKTAVSWVLVLLGVGLGLAAVCSPSARKRKLTEEEEEALEKKKKLRKG